MEQYLIIAIVAIVLFIIWIVIYDNKDVNKQINKIKSQTKNCLSSINKQLNKNEMYKEYSSKVIFVCKKYKFDYIWKNKVCRWLFIFSFILLIGSMTSYANIFSYIIPEKKYTDEELAKYNCKELLKTKNAKSIREWCGKYGDALSPRIIVSKRDLLNGTSKYCGGDAMANWATICSIEIHHPNNIVRKEWQRYQSAQIIIRGKLWDYGEYFGMMIDNPSFIGYNN